MARKVRDLSENRGRLFVKTVFAVFNESFSWDFTWERMSWFDREFSESSRSRQRGNPKKSRWKNRFLKPQRKFKTRKSA
jgi:hypothetical protein